MSTTMNFPPEAATFTNQQFEVDPDVTDLKRELKVRKYPRLWFVRGALSLAAVSFAAWLLFFRPYSSPAVQTSPLQEAICITIGMVIVLSYVVHVLGSITQVNVAKGNTERRQSQRSLKASTHVARKLDLPTLTKQHVEAGIRLDTLISEKDLNWTSQEEDQVRSLLLADLAREEPLRSIIEDRSIITPEEITKALNEMESNGKPLQSGWL